MSKRAHYLVSALAAALLLDAGVAAAELPDVAGAFYFRENRGANDLGVTPNGLAADRLVFGAGSVLPNGDAGTTATRAFGASDPVPLFFNPRTVSPNQFSGAADYTSGRASLPVNLAFTNESDTFSVSVSAVGTIGQMPLAFDLGVSGTGTALTFHWSIPVIPAGLTLERAQILVYDRQNFNARNVADTFYQAFLASPTDTSYALPGALAGDLELNHQYAFGIRLEDLREGVNPAFGGPARLSTSQAYFNFTPTAPIPEPETYALMIVGLGLVGWQLRRKKLPAAAS